LFNYSTPASDGNKKAEPRYVDPQTGEVTRSRVVGQGGTPLPPAGGNPGQRSPLSIAHICTGEVDYRSRVEIWGDGSLVRGIKQGPWVFLGGGERGPVTGFSRNSRRRLQNKLAEVKRDKLPVFVTLTYPDDYPGDPKQWKKDIHWLFTRLVRAFEAACGAWRMELKRRESGEINEGEIAPHFHMLVWGVKCKELLDWICENWYEIAGGGDINHLYWHQGLLHNKPCVQEVHSLGGVRKYTSKYVAKEEEEQDVYKELVDRWGSIGRVWGFFNKEAIPWSECETLYIPNKEVCQLIRYMKRYMGMRHGRRSCPSLRMMCNDPGQWRRLIVRSGDG